MKDAVKILSFFIFGLLLSAASASFPPNGYKAYDNVVTSPDKSFCVKQCYKQPKKDEKYQLQLWIFDGHGENGCALIHSDDVAGFDDGIVLSPDSRWLLRIKHLYAGTYTVFLCKRGKGIHFSPLLNHSLGDAAWKFYAKQPRITEEMIPSFHQRVDFEEWRDNRYLILNLSGSNYAGDSWDGWIVSGWLCAFDLEKKRFLLLPDLILKNKGKIYFKKAAAH